MATLRIGIIGKNLKEDKLKSRGLIKKRLKKAPEYYNELLLSTKAHKESMDRLKRLLEKNRFEYRVYENSSKKIKLNEKLDLWISLGGDGTFLYASHQGIQTPILGINSSPKTSVGNFCRFNMFDHSEQLSSLLTKIKNRQVEPIKFERLELRVDEKILPIPVLNDVLVAEKNPAKISSYIITHRNQRESHKSSGVWIASYNGSTAAYRSAGGKPFLLQNLKKKRRYAFLVREIYERNKKNLNNEVVREDDFFEIISTMSNGTLYLDGYRNTFKFGTGSALKVDFHPEPLFSF